MSEAIVVSIITGVLTLIGVLISNSRVQGVMETKVDELTREVREHNNFAKRVPVMEEQVKSLQERVKQLETKH